MSQEDTLKNAPEAGAERVALAMQGDPAPASEPIPTAQAVEVVADAKPAMVQDWRVPSADVYEHDGDLRLALDVPGATAAHLRVTVEQGHLVLEAPRADQPGRGYRRVLRLPDRVDVDAVRARLAHGVLTIDLPLAASARRRVVPLEA